MMGRFGLLALALVAACSDTPPRSEPLAENEIAFGVFGDGPYNQGEEGRFERVLTEVASSDLEWLFHVGDISMPPCGGEELLERRYEEFQAVPLPIVYTPGDNEWADCHAEGPLDRLAAVRRTFFAEPGRTLGGRTMSVETQASDSSFAEFVENVRWVYGGFVFSTIHLVGSNNGTVPFEGRTAADDEEVVRRTAAAREWLDETFAHAQEVSAKGVVVTIHANPWTGQGAPRPGYGDFLDRLGEHVGGFDGPVQLIHGDTHAQRVDHPLTDVGGRPYANFTRVETFGSPDIGWIRVVLDTVAGQVVRHEPKLMPGP